MSCSGQHFSVHSPDCKAHLNIQSNRPLQVEALASASSVTQLDDGGGGLDARQQRASSCASMDARPASVSPAQLVQLRAGQDATIRCPSGELIRTSQLNVNAAGTNEEQAAGDNNNNTYTLLILDCSPHPDFDGLPAGELQGRQLTASGATSSACESACCDDCLNRCHCQTELIVRQQIEHEHACQHQRRARPQERLQFYGSGSLADRSASQTTSRSQETIASQAPPFVSLQVSPVGRRSQRSPQQQVERAASSSGQQTTTTETTTTITTTRMQQQQQQQQQRERERECEKEEEEESGRGEEARRRQRPHRAAEDQSWAQREPSWQPLGELQTGSMVETVAESRAEQSAGRERPPTPPQQHEPRLSPRPGTKIVKRWNWNRAQFVEAEVPDRPQARPRAPDQLPAGSPAGLGAAAPDAWNQEMEALSWALSPTPAIQCEPSWLAHRPLDEASIQSDPLYRDFMVELRQLEENLEGRDGQRARGREQAATPDCQQRPAFGQPLEPASLELNECESAEFIGRLIPNSDPTMRVEWTLNGRPLLESSRLTSEYEFGVVRLLIRRCETQDSGIYQCRASNQLGESLSRVKLSVQAKSSVQCETLHPAGMEKIRQLEEPKRLAQLEEPPAQQAPKFLTHILDYAERDEGESVHFECCLAPVDDPELRAEWFFNGRPLATGSRFHTIDDFGFIVLDIDWLYPRDTGEYICRAANKWGSDLTRTVLRVRPARSIVLESQLATNAAATMDKLRQLDFPDLAPDEGPPEPASGPAHFVQQLHSANNKRLFTEGDNVHLEARAGPAADGRLTVEWFHNGRPLISGHRFKPAFDFGHILLDILYVYPEDSGLYRCVARNGQGEAAVSELELSVTGKQAIVYQSQLPKEMEGGVQKITDMEAMWNRAPDPEEEEQPLERTAPHFLLHLKPCAAFEGSCARFSCRLLARPRARVAWFLNGQLVVSGARYKLTRDGLHHLIIPKCQLQDAGRVRVVARNLLGECASESELRVKRKVDDYRGVLKNSPNPWYDEQTLKVYRRQRLQAEEEDEEEEEEEEEDDDDDEAIEDVAAYDDAKGRQHFDQFLANFQKRRQRKQRRAQLRLAAERQTSSPLANQLIGYMEPGTPDVNLLAAGSSHQLTSSIEAPLVEPGDLHPVVIERQAIMAPAPSTVGRALSRRDQVQSSAEFALAGQRQQSDEDRDRDQNQGESQGESQNQGESWSRAQNGDSAGGAASSRQQQDSQLRVFGLAHRQQQHQGRERTHQQELQQGHGQRAHAEVDDLQQRQQQRQRGPGLPAGAPESVEHGKEVHSHFHKQLQVERRPNKEIMREIIEKETFEQEHRGFSRESLVRDNSRERSLTPARPQQQQRRGQVSPAQAGLQGASNSGDGGEQVLIEEHMIPPEFVHKIQPCQAIEGDEARFECAFRGQPQPAISWFRENKLLRPSNLYAIESDLSANTSRLTIRRAALSANAVYTVKAENAAGSAKSSANLVVEAHPLPSASRGGQARQFDALEHLGGAHSSAASAASDVRGLSPADSSSEYSLLLDDSNSQSGQLSQSGQQQQQRIKSVRTRRLSPDQMGSLMRASPDNLVAPAFLHTLNEAHVKPGELARLDARLVGSQPMEVRWLKDGQRVRADKQHKLLLEGDLFTLLILESSANDEGFYECVAANRAGEARCGASLRVSSEGRHSAAGSASGNAGYSGGYGGFAPAAPPTSAGRGPGSEPAETFGMSSAGASTSSSVSASASASASQQQQQQQQQQLSTATALGPDGGARQHFGLTNKPRHQLMREYTSAQQQRDQPAALIPKLIKGLESQQVREGKSATLRCQISAHPEAEVSWFRQGHRPIKPSKYFRIFKDNDETHCLKILETFAEDQGEYKCVARAQHGQLETSATVTVIPNSPPG